MAAFSFPTNPNPGQEHEQNGLVYSWSGVAWDIVDHTATLLDRKAFVTGDTFTGPVTLPPGNPTRGYEATHKNYVDSMAGGKVLTEDEPPADAPDDALWYDTDQGGLYLHYRDASGVQWIQVNGAGGSGSTLLDSAPVTDLTYGLRNKAWQPVHQATYGDVKNGFQGGDHNGWIKLDGRAITALTQTQQNQAVALGWTTAIPNADSAVLMQNASSTLGVVQGAMSRNIEQANLPAIKLTAASAGGHAHTITMDPVGNHQHPSYGADGSDRSFDDLSTSADTWNIKFKNDTVIFATADSDAQTRYIVAGGGGHTPTGTMNNTGAHEHEVTLNGGTRTGFDITPKHIVANMFVFLGF